MRKHLILLGILLFITFEGLAFDHSHKKWATILNSHLKTQGHQTLINYKQIKANSNLLDSYLSHLENITKEEFDSFNKEQQLAFLINAYNAFTVKIIINHYPVKSIKDIGSIFRSTWKKKFFTLFGKKTHLDNIEHGMIRKWFDEPRIHFAVVCASLGCPPLADTPYTEKNLESLLEKQTINFLTDKAENRVENGKLYLSKIFKWYGKDFNSKFGSDINFIEKYIPNSRNLDREYLDYDWKLNEF